MVTISNLEVNFDVEGEGDEATFARLFEKYVDNGTASRKKRRSANDVERMSDHWVIGKRLETHDYASEQSQSKLTASKTRH